MATQLTTGNNKRKSSTSKEVLKMIRQVSSLVNDPKNGIKEKLIPQTQSR